MTRTAKTPCSIRGCRSGGHWPERRRYGCLCARHYRLVLAEAKAARRAIHREARRIWRLLARWRSSGRRPEALPYPDLVANRRALVALNCTAACMWLAMVRDVQILSAMGADRISRGEIVA